MNKEDINKKLHYAEWRVRNKYYKFKNFIRDKGGALVDWVKDNPTETVALLGLGVSGIKASQSLVVNHRITKERNRIDRTYYDPSTGFHWDLRRKATNNDRLMITERKRNGESTDKILRDLRLI